MGWLREFWAGASLRRRNRLLYRQVLTLQRQMEAERERHRIREEALVDRICTSRNQYGLPDVPAPGVQPARRAAPPAVSEPVNEMERAQLELYVECAVDAGLPAAKGRRDWEEWRESQRRRVVTELDDDAQEDAA